MEPHVTPQRPSRVRISRYLRLTVVAGALVIALCLVTLTACGTRSASIPAAPAGSTPAAGSATAGTATAGTATAEPGTTVTIPAPGPVSHPPGRIVAGRSGRVTLTQSDSGATVVLARGQFIIVVLGAPGYPTWDQPLAAGPQAASLRRVSASGGYPSSAPARATFLAVRPGTAAIRSLTDAACLHAKPRCMIAQRVWQVSVIVRP